MASPLAHVAFLSSALTLLLAVLLVTAIGFNAPTSTPIYPKQHLLTVRSNEKQQHVRELRREHYSTTTMTTATDTEFGRKEVAKEAAAAARERRLRGLQGSRSRGSGRISAEGVQWKEQESRPGLAW